MVEDTWWRRLRRQVWRVQWMLLRLPHPLWCREGEWLEDEPWGDHYCSECGIYREWPG